MRVICQRHGGEWGTDQTCARCTWSDGTPRPIPTMYDEVICVCGDSSCGCGCIPGGYPCEHGSAGEGCGS